MEFLYIYIYIYIHRKYKGTRSELDARKSPTLPTIEEDGQSLMDSLDAWQKIADAFNDYEQY